MRKRHRIAVIASIVVLAAATLGFLAGRRTSRLYRAAVLLEPIPERWGK